MDFAGFSDRSRAFRHVSAGFQWAEFSMHGFLLSSLWAILGHNGDNDASVLLLIEDGGWNLFLATVASSSKGGVNVWYPLVPTAYASLLVSVTCCGWFCELLCSLWFFNDDVWVQSAANGFLPLLMVFYAWTTDIACSTTVIWFWCSYHTYLQ